MGRLEMVEEGRKSEKPEKKKKVADVQKIYLCFVCLEREEEVVISSTKVN